MMIEEPRGIHRTPSRLPRIGSGRLEREGFQAPELGHRVARVGRRRGLRHRPRPPSAAPHRRPARHDRRVARRPGPGSAGRNCPNSGRFSAGGAPVRGRGSGPRPGGGGGARLRRPGARGGGAGRPGGGGGCGDRRSAAGGRAGPPSRAAPGRSRGRPARPATAAGPSGRRAADPKGLYPRRSGRPRLMRLPRAASRREGGATRAVTRPARLAAPSAFDHELEAYWRRGPRAPRRRRPDRRGPADAVVGELDRARLHRRGPPGRRAASGGLAALRRVPGLRVRILGRLRPLRRVGASGTCRPRRGAAPGGGRVEGPRGRRSVRAGWRPAARSPAAGMSGGDPGRARTGHRGHRRRATRKGTAAAPTSSRGSRVRTRRRPRGRVPPHARTDPRPARRPPSPRPRTPAPAGRGLGGRGGSVHHAGASATRRGDGLPAAAARRAARGAVVEAGRPCPAAGRRVAVGAAACPRSPTSDALRRDFHARAARAGRRRRGGRLAPRRAVPPRSRRASGPSRGGREAPRRREGGRFSRPDTRP